MKPTPVLRPFCAALCGLALATLPQLLDAQERPRDERPPEGQRPPRGDFKPDERARGEGRPPEPRREEPRREEPRREEPRREEPRREEPRREEPRREELRRDQAPRGEFRPGERGEVRGVDGQRGGVNPQDLFHDLNDQQRMALRGFFETNQDVMRETGEKLARLRREIAESAVSDKPNEELIRDKSMAVAKLEADVTLARARAFARVRDQLPKETVERLRKMMANFGPRPGFQPQGGADVRREGGDVRRPAEGDFRRPDAPRDGVQVRRPGEADRGPRPDGDRGPRPDGDRGPRPDGDRGPRVDGDRGPRPEGDRGPQPGGERGRKPVEDRRPEAPRRPPADQ